MPLSSEHLMLGGSSDALSVYLSWKQAEIKSSHSISLVEPTLKNQPSVHWIYYVPESLFELISEPLQHRLNRCPYEACTGAMTQAWILSETPTATNWTQRDRLNRRIHLLTCRFFRWSRFFCSELPTAM